MKTLTKILLLSLVCANFAHAGGTSLKQKFETSKAFFGSTVEPQPVFGSIALSLPKLIAASAFIKASTTALARPQNNSMVLVGKNSLKSLGGSLIASVLLWISNPDKNGLFGALNNLNIWQNNALHRRKRGTTTVSNALKFAALISYLAGQNNWDPRTGLTPKGIKELFTKKYTTTEQFEFVVNTFLPLCFACDSENDSSQDYNRPLNGVSQPSYVKDSGPHSSEYDVTRAIRLSSAGQHKGTYTDI